jgi:tetratricopeptide (TPR) repeat protein
MTRAKIRPRASVPSGGSLKGPAASFLPWLIIPLVSLVVYFPILRGGFIWDDDVLITTNRLVLSPSGLPAIWRGEVNPDYFPLTSSLFWLEDRLWGLNPFGYHLVNILLHATAALLVWRVLLRLRVPWPQFAALLFAVHPVAVDSVAWIAETKNTLSSALALAATLQYLRWRDLRSSARAPYALACGFFLLALLAKTAVVTLPLVLLLCDWWRDHRILKRHVLAAAPFFVLSLLFGIITVWFQAARAIGAADISMGTPYARLCGAGKSIWFYLLKLLLPVHLSVIYPFWSSSRFPVIDAIPLILLLSAFALAWRWRSLPWVRAALFGLGAYCIVLLPVAGLLKLYYMIFAPVADHLQYFAMPAFLALAVAAIATLASSCPPVAPFARCALVLLSLAAGALTFRQSAVYSSSQTLWPYVVDQNPDSFEARQGYSLVLVAQHRLNDAIDQLRQAVALKPTFYKTRLNLAITLDQANLLDQSIDAYRDAIRIRPSEPFAHVGLGNALFRAGQPDQAALEYREAIRLNPGIAIAHRNLGVLLQRSGQVDAAGAEFDRARQLTPAPDLVRHN